MIPKWKLFLYSCTALVSLLFLFLVVVFVLSLIFFTLSRYGFLYLPLFGFMKTLHLLQALPVLLIFLCSVLLVAIEVISRKTTSSFRRPLVATLLFVTSLAVVLGFLITLTPMHEYVRDYAEEHNIPLVKKAYKRPLPLELPKGVTILRGEVVCVGSSSFFLEDFSGEKIEVVTTSSSLFLPEREIGRDILVLGAFSSSTFRAVQIKEAPIKEMRRRDMRNRKDRMMMDVVPRESLFKALEN